MVLSFENSPQIHQRYTLLSAPAASNQILGEPSSVKGEVKGQGNPSSETTGEQYASFLRYTLCMLVFSHTGQGRQFSSFYFTNFMNTKEGTFTIKMYNTSRKKERKRQTVNYLQKSNLTILLLQIDCK